MPDLAATGGPAPVADGREPDRRGGPYGLLGLTFGTVAILVVSLLMVIVAGALVFAVFGLAIGWHTALERFADLRTAAGSEQTFLQRAGVVVSLAVYAAVSATIVAAARLRGGRARWRELIAWRPWHPFRASRLVWLLIPLTIVYGLGADVLVAKLYPPSKDWVTLPTGVLWTSLFVVLAVVAAPITEELLFRGWIYTSLRARIGVWSAILVSSLLFALAHWENTHIYALAVFPVGLALAFIRERTGSIRASMVCHAAYNGAASLILVFGS